MYIITVYVYHYSDNLCMYIITVYVHHYSDNLQPITMIWGGYD